jgi:hypothetical protein
MAEKAGYQALANAFNDGTHLPLLNPPVSEKMIISTFADYLGVD